MLTSGDVVDLDLGLPSGHEAGFRHLAVIVTAQEILEESPSVVQVVPLTTTYRRFGSEVAIEPDEANCLDRASVAQCQQIGAISSGRIEKVRGNLGGVALSQIREVLSLILGIS